jgi:pimeloyl-ACP methyl ester carboxylesterase
MSDVHPAGNLAMLRGMAEADLRDVLPRIDVPTLVLHGLISTDVQICLSVANCMQVFQARN